MRKLKLQMQVSLDGFVAGPNGEMDWLTWTWDDELKQYVTELTELVDTLVLGRKLAEGFIPTWTSRAADPQTADAFSHKMVDLPKIVFSKTLESSLWEQTIIAKGELAEEINALKAQPGSDIIAYGGGGFVSNLVKYNLIDEYNLFVNPVLIGKGMPIFRELEAKQDLKLVKAVPFSCGIVALRYQAV